MLLRVCQEYLEARAFGLAEPRLIGHEPLLERANLLPVLGKAQRLRLRLLLLQAPCPLRLLLVTRQGGSLPRLFLLTECGLALLC